MANAVWPASLPQEFQAPGHQRTLPDAKLRTEVDAPVPKQRRRFTAAVAPVRGEVRVTAAQLATFEAFFETTLGFGALPFDWTRTTVGVLRTYRFVTPPDIRPHSRGLRWIVGLDLEVLP